MLRKLSLITALVGGLAMPVTSALAQGFLGRSGGHAGGFGGGRGAGVWHWHGDGGVWHWHGGNHRGYPIYWPGGPSWGYFDSSCWAWDPYSGQWIWLCN